MASINPYQFEPKRRNVSRPTNVLGEGSHTPDVPVLLHDVTASALDEPIIYEQVNTVIKQSPPYRRLAVNRKCPMEREKGAPLTLGVFRQSIAYVNIDEQ